MKRTFTLFAALFAVLLSASRAEVASAKAAPVTVDFEDTEKFSDFKTSYMGTDKDRDYLQSEFRDYIVSEASRTLAAGQTLSVHIKDIDMAGDFEPWRMEMRDVRIVKDIYPPRIKLNFKVLDASGAVVKEGDRSLVDLDFLGHLHLNRNEPLIYEKALLKDWVHDELTPPKKS